MRVQVIPVTMFQSNCIVVWDPATMAGVVFDPGGEPGRILHAIETLGVTVKGIFLTHGHVDHVAGAARLKEATGAAVHLHADDLPIARAIGSQCLMFGIPIEAAPEPDHQLKEGDTFTIDALVLTVLHTPGHSPGSVAFQFTKDEPLLVSGDLLFAGSIGRMDLPGGDEGQMRASLARISTLPDSLTVLPGHGPGTTIGREKRTNPYLSGGLARW
jgi:glyoxylase-like metal-dependent hydrolase (beta-lactamase superfamily II)